MRKDMEKQDVASGVAGPGVAPDRAETVACGVELAKAAPLADNGLQVALENGALGMSMRDWFAVHALAGILTRADIVGSEARLQHVKESLARLSYQYADAMIAAREAKP